MLLRHGATPSFVEFKNSSNQTVASINTNGDINVAGSVKVNGSAIGAQGPQGAIGTQGLGYSGTTSTSSNSIGTGSKTWSTASTGAFQNGMYVRVINSTTNWVEGTITSLTSNTSITVNITKSNGSGTYTSWSFAAQGPQGADGAQGPQGSSGSISVSTSTSSVNYQNNTTKTFLTTNTSDFVVGQRLAAVNQFNYAQFIEGRIISVSNNSSVQIDVDSTQGPQGSQGVIGAQSSNSNWHLTDQAAASNGVYIGWSYTMSTTSPLVMDYCFSDAYTTYEIVGENVWSANMGEVYFVFRDATGNDITTSNYAYGMQKGSWSRNDAIVYWIVV